jgi:transcriptional regulator with XRE-family HTH domain
MTTDERIGANVHELLWRRRLRQEALMHAMGLSRSSLAKKLRGEVVWKAQDIEHAARVLNVDPGRLFAEQTELPASNTVTGRYHLMNVLTMPIRRAA